MQKTSIISGGIKQNRVVVEHGKITITDNALYYGDSVLQLANVSRTWVGVFDPVPTPKWAVIAIVIGVLALFAGLSEAPAMSIVGLLIGGVGGWGIYNHVKTNPPKYGIQIEMNSSFVAIFSSTDQTFLLKILKSIGDSFNGRFEGRIEEYNIEDKSVHIGHNAGIVNTGNNSSMNNAVNSADLGEKDGYSYKQ